MKNIPMALKIAAVSFSLLLAGWYVAYRFGAIPAPDLVPADYMASTSKSGKVFRKDDVAEGEIRLDSDAINAAPTNAHPNMWAGSKADVAVIRPSDFNASTQPDIDPKSLVPTTKSSGPIIRPSDLKAKPTTQPTTKPTTRPAIIWGSKSAPIAPGPSGED